MAPNPNFGSIVVQHVVEILEAAAAQLLASDRLYDPANRADRQELAQKLEQRLTSAGFKLEPTRNGEDVYVFQHRKDPGLHIKVYTSIYRGEMRARGKDAIRVVMLYQQQRNREKKVMPLGQDLPIVKRSSKSTIDTLVERVVDRAREAYKTVNEVERCHACKAPRLLSKKGNKYCGELCFLNKHQH